MVEYEIREQSHVLLTWPGVAVVSRSELLVLREHSEAAQKGAPTECLSLAAILVGRFPSLVTLWCVSMLSPLEPSGSNTIFPS